MIQFRFLNIPVTVHPQFFLFFFFFTGIHRGITIEGMMSGVILVVSLLIHEYGHALTAMYYGARPEINLEAFGGNAKYDGRLISAKQEFYITLNGPLFESVLIVIPYILLTIGFSDNAYVNYFLYVMMRLNILWCVLNLIPVLPLDGGHLLKYFLEKKLGDQGVKIASTISVITAVLCGSYLFVQEYYFFAILLFIYGFKNLQGEHAIGFGSGPAPFKLYNQGLRHLEDNETDKAKAIFNKLRKCRDEHIKAWSAESLAAILHTERRNREAYKTLSNVDHHYLSKGKSLLCKLAFEEGNYSLVEKYSREIYDIEPTYEVALLNSKAFACLNNPVSSGGWLKTASGFKNIELRELEDVLRLTMYNQVRDHEEFRKYLPDNLLTS